MKFNKLVLYDLEGSVSLSQQLKKFCDNLIVITTDKDFSGKIKPEDLVGADAFVTKIFDKYDETFFSKADKLKYVGLLSTGYNVIDVKYLNSKGVAFTNVPHYCTEGVAELTFSALLSIARMTHTALGNTKKGEYSLSGYSGWVLKGKTLGVIGLGEIGTRVAEIAKSFGMRVVYYSRTKKPEVEKKLGINYLELDELLKASDIISLHCPITAETTGLLNKERLTLLKKGAVLLFSASSELCDLDALGELTKQKKLSVWFDVLDDKKQREKLSMLDNIFVTPYLGWMTKEAQAELDKVGVENVKNFLEGKPSNVVI